MVPWEYALSVLATSITGPVARFATLIGIAVAGILWQHSDGGYARLAARILIGGAIAVGAANIYLFFFPIGVAV
jgi:type IV secretory pathway VirB2 component (pilin)